MLLVPKDCVVLIYIKLTRQKYKNTEKKRGGGERKWTAGRKMWQTAVTRLCRLMEIKRTGAGKLRELVLLNDSTDAETKK